MTDLASAMRSLVDRTFCQSERYGNQQRRAIRDGAHPDILEFEKRFITRLRKQDVPMFALWIQRDASAQLGAFANGRSKARPGQSPHNYGMAVDLIHGTKAYELSKEAWAMLGHIGKEISVQAGIKITWGGEWKFYDPAHWELSEWRTLSKGMEPYRRK